MEERQRVGSTVALSFPIQVLFEAKWESSDSFDLVSVWMVAMLGSSPSHYSRAGGWDAQFHLGFADRNDL